MSILSAHKNTSTSDEHLYANKIKELTDIHNIYFHRFRIGFPKRIGRHHRDVVYDPNRRVPFIEIAGVVPCCMIIWTFKDFHRAETEIF